MTKIIIQKTGVITLIKRHGYLGSLCLGILEVFFRSLNVGLHGFLSWFPASWTHLSVLVGILECLDQTQRFIDGPANGQVVDGDLTQDLFVVNDEQSAERNSRVFVEHTVVARNLATLVSKKGNVHFAKTALLPRRVHPCQMAEVGVCGRGDQFATDLLELLSAVGEGNYLGRADEREV